MLGGGGEAGQGEARQGCVTNSVMMTEDNSGSGRTPADDAVQASEGEQQQEDTASWLRDEEAASTARRLLRNADP
jgi:hypothetical protein